MVTQRSVGVDCASYPKGVLDALRMKPEVIAIGEIRDADTMRTVISAAETGHLIIGTMHASSAYQAIDRLLAQSGPDSRLVAQMLANNLLCVLAQNLIPAKDTSEADPKRVLCYEALFRSKELAQMLLSSHLNGQGLTPARIRELIQTGGGIDWNGCLDELVQRDQILAEDAAALKLLE